MSLGWPRESFTYDGCCTHFSINEQIVGRTENMPADEINRIDAERKIAKQRLYIANTGPGVYAANTRAYGEPPPGRTAIQIHCLQPHLPVQWQAVGTREAPHSSERLLRC
jgi:hypothetical protein